VDEAAVKKIFLDFETYYTGLYSLRFMTPLEYIMYHEFQMLGCGVAVDDGDPFFLPQEEVIDFLNDIKEPYACISHNALFDMTILAWRYAIHPAIVIDTMSMSRALLAHKIKRASVSLGNVLEYLGLEKKLETIKDMNGVNWTQLTSDAELMLRFVTYTLRDVRGCREIYNILIDDFPASELRVMDRIIRMVTMPQLLTDGIRLQEYYKEVVEKKENLLAKLGHERAKYMSAEKFAELLREQGVEPPKKWSVKQNDWVYAFAKTDAEFIALREDENETVAQLVEARLGLKTTIEETRCRRLIAMVDVAKHILNYCWLPIPLKYSGAHTHRFSGDWKLNFQNLSTRKQKMLRSTILAPSGTKILAVDASQIEARLTAWLAGQENLLEQFRIPDNDIYSWFASIIYERPITRADKVERFNGKTIVLGLGYGMGPTKLLLKLTTDALEAGIKAEYTLDQCQEWVGHYRNLFLYIPALWRKAQGILNAMLNTNSYNEQLLFFGQIGPCYPDGNTIVLPSGLRLYYDNLSFDGEEITYTYGNTKRKIYGAKLIENIVQALDRQHVIEANMRIENRCRVLGWDIRLAMQVHDENVYVVPEDKLDPVKQICLEEMCRPPKWASDLPLAAEVKIGNSFGELE
jgi:DNA polymerase